MGLLKRFGEICTDKEREIRIGRSLVYTGETVAVNGPDTFYVFPDNLPVRVDAEGPYFVIEFLFRVFNFNFLLK